MTRFPDWAARLDSFLRSNAHRKFAYGEWDCCLFVCEAIDAMTGEDPGAEFRGRYATRSAARVVIAQETLCGQRSVGNLVDIVTRRHRMEMQAPLLARRGDVALLKRSRDFSLALVALDGKSLIVAAAKGLTVAPLSLAVRAWKV